MATKKNKTQPCPETSEQEQLVLYPTMLFNETPGDAFSQGKSAIASCTYMRGLVMGICDEFKRPVVILQKNNNKSKSCENCENDGNTAFCCSGNYSRLESTLFYDNWAKLCKKIREDDGKIKCCKRDEIITEYLLNNINSTKKSTAKIPFGEEEIVAHITKEKGENPHICIRYECPVSHYDEIAVNINVNGIEGVMIIGQFLFKDTSVQQNTRFEETVGRYYKNDEIEQFLKDVKSTQKTAEETVAQIFKCVRELENALNIEYISKVESNVKILQDKMIKTFDTYYKNNFNSIDIYENKIQICERKYEVLKVAFSNALEELKKAKGKIDLYYSIPSGLYFNSKNDTKKVSGCLTKEEENIFNSYIHQKLNEFEKVSDNLLAYSKKLDLHEEKYVSLFIKSNTVDKYIKNLFDSFLQFSCIYITELFAQFSGAQITEYTTMMRHEFGQLNEAILIRVNTFQEAISKQNEDDYTYGFLDECNHMIADFKSHAHSTMLKCNSSRYFSLIPDLHKEWFYPYESFLHKWKYIYSKAAKNKHLDFVMAPVQLSDLSRPRMYADKSMIEQIAYNLTNNALKYSIPGTTINIDCRLNDEKNKYLIIVSNYGRAISKKEEENIFKYGFRGSNHNDASGSGLGLYLSREIAETHGGTLDLETEYISEYDVSCLYLYNDMPDRFIDYETKKKVEDELNRLEQTNHISEMKRPLLANESFTPYLIKKYLTKGTMKYKFILSIPYDKTGG